MMNLIIVTRHGNCVNMAFSAGIMHEEDTITYLRRDGEELFTEEYESPEDMQNDLEFIHRALRQKAWLVDLNQVTMRI